MKCRTCDMELYDYIDLFLHNYMGDCPKDSVIEFLDQVGKAKGGKYYEN